MKAPLLILCPFVFFLAACEPDKNSARGFSLPEGNIVSGQIAFVKFKCSDCHSVYGLDELREGVEPERTVPLGGKTTRVATYGQLVTSIINPSHKISQKYLVPPVVENGQSKMPIYNDVMTVQELIDIVTFLQDRYELEPYPQTQYMIY